MGEIIHNKLVRDNIPEIITADGATPIIRIMEDEENRHESRRKLVEEAMEVFQSGGDIGEYADLIEAFSSALIADGHTLEQLDEERKRKAKERGAFTKRIFLEKVIKNDD